jgi:hypothetical protein
MVICSLGLRTRPLRCLIVQYVPNNGLSLITWFCDGYCQGNTSPICSTTLAAALGGTDRMKTLRRADRNPVMQKNEQTMLDRNRLQGNPAWLDIKGDLFQTVPVTTHSLSHFVLPIFSVSPVQDEAHAFQCSCHVGSSCCCRPASNRAIWQSLRGIYGSTYIATSS